MGADKFAAVKEQRDRLVAEQRERAAARQAEADHQAKLAQRRERDRRRKRQAHTLAFREALAALCNQHGFKVEAASYDYDECSLDVADLPEGEIVTADAFDPWAGADK